MKRNITILLLISFNLKIFTQGFDVHPAGFSTLINNEFSPVFYQNGIVFCSDLKNNSLINYRNEGNNLFNIFFIEMNDSGKRSKVVLFAKELTTNFNEGPVSFSSDGNTAYFCRNIETDKSRCTSGLNHLGIFSARFMDGKWGDIRPVSFNNPDYSYITPALSPDGKRLYFASDMPGGFGGTDLYYSEWEENDWGPPVNCGSSINTSGNEGFPFVTPAGKLFFSSDGHESLGGKDIYYSQQIRGIWIKPIHPEPGINSAFDDFGIVTDDELSEGYFSTGRRKNDDIYRFVAKPVTFTNCGMVVKSSYCFLFYDEFQAMNDSVPVRYNWDFGDGTKKTGPEVEHCFPGPGKYSIRLTITDPFTDTVLSETAYDYELKDVSGVDINSADEGLAGEPLRINGLQKNSDTIAEYMWDFGEGFNTRGPVAEVIFQKPGEYLITLGLLGKKDTAGVFSKTCAAKKVQIFENVREMAENSGIILSGDPDTGKINEIPVTVYLTNNLSGPQKLKIKERLKGMTYFVDWESPDSVVFRRITEIMNSDPLLRLIIFVPDEGKAKWGSRINTFFEENELQERVICTGQNTRKSFFETVRAEKDPLNRMEFVFIPSDFD